MQLGHSLPGASSCTCKEEITKISQELAEVKKNNFELLLKIANLEVIIEKLVKDKLQLIYNDENEKIKLFTDYHVCCIYFYIVIV